MYNGTNKAGAGVGESAGPVYRTDSFSDSSPAALMPISPAQIFIPFIFLKKIYFE